MIQHNNQNLVNLNYGNDGAGTSQAKKIGYVMSVIKHPDINRLTIGIKKQISWCKS